MEKQNCFAIIQYQTDNPDPRKVCLLLRTTSEKYILSFIYRGKNSLKRRYEWFQTDKSQVAKSTFNDYLPDFYIKMIILNAYI